MPGSNYGMPTEIWTCIVLIFVDDLPPVWISLGIASRQKKAIHSGMARHGRYPQGCHYHYRIKPLFRSTWFHYALLYFWAHVRAYPFLVKTCQDPTSAAWSTQGIESKSHDIMLEEPCRTNAWSIPISSPISKEDTCIRDIKKLLVRRGRHGGHILWWVLFTIHRDFVRCATLLRSWHQ